MVSETEKKLCARWWYANILNVFLIVVHIQIPTRPLINVKYGMMDAIIVFLGPKLRPINPLLLDFSLMTQLILLKMASAQRELALDKILRNAWNGKFALLMGLNRKKQIKSRNL